jgi:alginate O-acetyltransferase complex protein AlgJ
MRKFIVKILSFILLPVIIITVIEVCFFPINYFNYRNWEALLIKSDLPHFGPFFPNKTVNSIEMGDLAHHTHGAIKKKCLWVTDELGFRNYKFIKKPDVLIIGDSFMNGTSLTQEDIFSNQLDKLTNEKYSFYCMAPYTFENWVRLFEKGIVDKPKLIVFSNVENTIPESFKPKKTLENPIKKKIKDEILKTNLAVLSDRCTRFYSMKWLSARIKGNKGEGIQSPINQSMYFLNGSNSVANKDVKIQETINAIKTYNSYCKSKNISFLYLPMPNKESVYFEYIPSGSKSNYIDLLCNNLQKNEVNTINTLSVFYKNKYENKLMYHLDDTHWNRRGVQILSSSMKDSIINILTSKK